jgi:ABC-type glutathione transport system ATPase component
MTTEGFSVSIHAGRRPIVSVDKFDVAADRITFLFGESGIGKSMISKAIYGLLDPDELRVAVNNRPYGDYCNDPATREIKENSFFVFQEPSSHLNPLMKISDQLNEGSLSASTAQSRILSWLWGTGDEAAPKRVLDVFPKPYRPSGGEKQRVLLAMAFKKIDLFIQSGDKKGRSFFVFDEPTGSLDNTYRNLFLQLLFECYGKRPFTVMIITHDYSVISEVYANYRPLLEKIHFKELRRTGGAAVEVVDFSANEYLSWLSASAGTGPAASGAAVLDMDAHFKVFGRRLCLYRDAQHTQPANCVIRKGEMVYVKAPSGVGKTTLAKVIMGLYQSQKCAFDLCGMKITERTTRRTWARRIWGTKAGMVFQHADEALDLQATVKETFDGLHASASSRGGRDGLKGKLLELFEAPLTDAFLAKKVGMLSGGQKQRLNLLRTLSLGTDLIILDEPLNGLDFVSVKKVMSLLEQKLKQGSALLMISHNEEIFDHFVDKKNVYYLAEEIT